MFEPFHSNKIDLLSDWNFRQYLRPSDRSDKYLKPATAILSGNIRSDWIDKYNRRLFSRKRLIKDIRAQHILRWIYINFPEIPIVLLLRHPCAVANSKLKLGWDAHLQDFLVQDALMEDFLNPFKRLLQTAKNNFEKHILMWCVENYVPLKQFSEGEILIVFYEDICRNPKQEIQRILAFIGEEFSAAFNSGFSKPSAESRKESAIVSGSDLIGSWRESISDDQTARSVEILGVFGLREIYNESEFPLLTGSEVLKLFRH